MIEAQEFSMLLLTLAMMFADIISGAAKACKKGILSSSVMRDGIWHKSALVGLVALAYMLQIGQAYADFGAEIPTVTACCAFIIATEAVSIVENLCELNPEIKASPVGKVFRALNEDEKSEND